MGYADKLSLAILIPTYDHTLRIGCYTQSSRCLFRAGPIERQLFRDTQLTAFRRAA